MTAVSPLDSARRKAFWRLLPLLFIAYVIAYVDRQNVSLAKLAMSKDMPAFNDAVIGLGAGIFFIGYFLLEIPGSLIVERWSARKWICRIMVTWGIMAGLTALVKTPVQFYTVRFFLGLAEAGFFPGVLVYLTHWFPSRDRARAIATFLVATPFAQVLSPKISEQLLKIGVEPGHPAILGMVSWQWMYIFWAIPALLMGFVILFWLTDRPLLAKWLTPDEAQALEAELERERAITKKGRRMTAMEAVRNPKVLLLALAYFCTVTGSYGIEFFMPSILDSWYGMKMSKLTWLIMLPPAMAFLGQMYMGWSSDRYKERRIHAVVPIIMGSISLALLPHSQGNLWLTMILLMTTFTGFKAYMPAFWSLPSMFLTGSAAASSMGLINSIGNLGGALGPSILGYVQTVTKSYNGGLYYLSASMMVAAFVILSLGVGKKVDEKAGES